MQSLHWKDSFPLDLSIVNIKIEAVNKTSNYHHGNLRLAMLEAADKVLQEHGLQGFTLRACAREAGVSHAAPKHHFGDVKGLLTAVAERGFARLVAALTKEVGAVAGDLDAEMIATARAYIQFAEDYPEHFRIMFRTDLTDIDPYAPPTSVLATFTELTNIILRQRGERELEMHEMALEKSNALVNDIILGWSHIHGYAHLKLEGGLIFTTDDMQEKQMTTAALRLAHLIRNYTFSEACPNQDD